MNYLIYLFLGFTPSIIWLLFFLRKDSHPESNPTILRVFGWGMMAALPTALIELGLNGILAGPLYVFLGIAFTEEFSKYFVVRKKVLKHPEFDEPVDIMLYMIISALGFAALENLLILLPLAHPFQFWESFLVGGFRFVGATFLHALSSGLFGYYLALSFFEPKKRTKLFLKGLIAATLLHGLYNLSIIEIDNGLRFAAPIIILLGLAIVVSLGFKKVKKLQSICLPAADE